ncbi:MAG: ATP-binding protein [Gammaproteobacteria bacterium]|nr:ATP-binding protein [Gammaproteobacteria bacterium]
MYDFEKLGAFYLGKRVDTDTNELTDELVLYDSKDLTTHAVIIGMTGSGKTGLGIGMLEEAGMDHIPVIAIDPKGDLGNMLLTFPELRPEDFRPWVNTRQATDAGQTPDEFAKAQAALWKKGLAQWGQDGARIAQLRENVDLAIYTPGSTAGLPVSVLKSFAAPAQALLDDSDMYRDRVQATATGILSLLRIKADPISSREHILISRLLDHAWQDGRDLGVAALIAEIQNPPLQRIGVMDLDSFYPAKDRFALAMQLNNLLAAPGFEAWIEGEPLNAAKLLYTDAGKPRISIMSIAHLDDAERMFFVSMLLNELIAWMRAQQGTSSLRAILYMDEIFGYMPPVENPPSKKLLLTLLKQARAYGLGLALATQNPVDLDYRGLSNTGTWMIGRLQTERDKARVMEGLEGVSQGGKFDKPRMERTLAGLGKRRFLLHNVHEDEAVVFNTRWAMSYLAGPLTRDQIKSLAASSKPAAAPVAVAAAPAKTGVAAAVAAPVLPPSIKQYFVAGPGDELVYFPRLIAATDVAFTNARYKVDERREQTYAVEFADGPVTVDWDEAELLPLSIADLDSNPEPGASFTDCPRSAMQEKNYADWEKQLKRWVRQNESIALYRSKTHSLTSEPGESEGEFRARLQQAASEKRDQEVAKLRKRYAAKATTLENRLLRAEQAIQREAQQSSKKKIDTAISFGTAILGAVLGRKRLSTATASRMGTAIRTASGARKEAGDVARAQETAEKVRADLAALNEALEAEVAALDTAYDAQTEALTEIPIRPKTTDIHVPLIGLVWMPYRDVGDGRLQAAWSQ